MNLPRALQLWLGFAPPAPEGVVSADEDLTPQARQLLRQLGDDALANKVAVRWNPRMRSTAGTANSRTSTITLNPLLRQFGAGEVELTLKHELAHLLAQHRAGRRRIAPHGTEWRAACRELGIAHEKRCHTLPLPRRRLAKTHFYECRNCRAVLERTRPIRRKVACLPCCRAYGNGRYEERFRLVLRRRNAASS